MVALFFGLAVIAALISGLGSSTTGTQSANTGGENDSAPKSSDVSTPNGSKTATTSTPAVPKVEPVPPMAPNSAMPSESKATANGDPDIYTEREWTSADGKRTFVGRLAELNGETVTIIKEGTRFTITFDKLSDADRKFLGQGISFTAADGEQYQNLSLRRIEPISISFAGATGMTYLAPDKLPEDLKKRFPYRQPSPRVPKPPAEPTNEQQFAKEVEQRMARAKGYASKRAEIEAAQSARLAQFKDRAPASATASVTVSQSQFGDEWPFTVSEGVIGFEPLGGSLCILTFTSGGATYALNGLAATRGYREIEAIWRPDPTIPIAGARIDISPIIKRGLALGQ